MRPRTCRLRRDAWCCDTAVLCVFKSSACSCYPLSLCVCVCSGREWDWRLYPCARDPLQCALLHVSTDGESRHNQTHWFQEEK